MIRKEDNKVIGRAGIENREIDGELQKELGYLIGKPWQGMGYAAEACLAILDYVKERELCSHLFYAVIKKYSVNQPRTKTGIYSLCGGY